LGFRVTVGRHLEKNYLLDDHDGNLQKAGKVLRIRKTPSGRTLTYKGPISAASKLSIAKRSNAASKTPTFCSPCSSRAVLKFARNIRSTGRSLKRMGSKFRSMKPKPAIIWKSKDRPTRTLRSLGKNWGIRKRILSVEPMQS